MEFWTKLIVVKKEPTLEAVYALKLNCTHVANGVWIFEGEQDALVGAGVEFLVLGEGAVPCLGDLDKSELVDLCMDVYGVDAYQEYYQLNKEKP